MLEILLRTVHLAAVGVAVWLPAYCMALDWRRNCDPNDARVQRKLILHTIHSMVVGAVTGALYGVMLWRPSFQAALTAIGPRLGFAIVEFCFTLAVFAAYWIWTFRKFALGRGWRLLAAFVLFVATTNVAYHFPILLGVVRHLSDHPGSSQLSSAEFRELGFSPTILFASLHFLLGSFAIANQVAIGLLRRESVSERFLRVSIGISLLTGLLQWPTGLLAFVRRSRDVRVDLVSFPDGVGLALAMGSVWVFMAMLIGLWFRPRSARWWIASTAGLCWVLIQMSWLRLQ